MVTHFMCIAQRLVSSKRAYHICPWWPHAMPALPQPGYDGPHVLSAEFLSPVVGMVP